MGFGQGAFDHIKVFGLAPFHLKYVGRTLLHIFSLGRVGEGALLARARISPSSFLSIGIIAPSVIFPDNVLFMLLFVSVENLQYCQ